MRIGSVGLLAVFASSCGAPSANPPTVQQRCVSICEAVNRSPVCPSMHVADCPAGCVVTVGLAQSACPSVVEAELTCHEALTTDYDVCNAPTCRDQDDAFSACVGTALLDAGRGLDAGP